MTRKELITFLESYNKWRRGDDTIQQPSPILIGAAIDEAVKLLKSLDKNATNKAGL